jgi:hypothetical protein
MVMDPVAAAVSGTVMAKAMELAQSHQFVSPKSRDRRFQFSARAHWLDWFVPAPESRYQTRVLAADQIKRSPARAAVN